MDDLIEEIRDKEDINDMLTAQRIADAQRWAKQEKTRFLKKLAKQELIAELAKRS